VLRSRSASVLGYTNSSLTREQRRDALTAVLRLAASGQVVTAYHSRPLSEVSDAWRQQAAGEGTSRVVLVP
jgi:D-arabinose 1-dehydrogenase-like Zn-dependent alcohol dehydrogenase